MEPLDSQASDIGTAVVTATPSWVELAAYSRDLFSCALEDLGLPELLRHEGLALRDRVNSDLIEHEDLLRQRDSINLAEREAGRARLFGRLADWIRGLDRRVDGPTEVRFDVPLFVLSAPNIDGCSTSLTQTDRWQDTVDWNLSIIGSGFGRTADVRASFAWTVSATAGTAKQPFLPVTVEISRVSTYVDKRLVAEGFQLSAPQRRSQWAPGVRVLPESDAPADGELVCHYLLVGDTTGEIAKYRVDVDRNASREVRIGLPGPLGGIGARVEVLQGRAVSIDMELKGGHDYRLYRTQPIDGIAWRLDGSI